MKILFTGGSSFTGAWFVRELARAGHDVVAIFQRSPDAYTDDLRRKRVMLVLEHARGVFDCSFGDEKFIELLRSENWGLLCHHAADVTDYKSESFDIAGALAGNTRNAADVLNVLAQQGSRPSVVLTGSVFENDEGAGAEELAAFSPYGLSKSLTYQVFRYQVAKAGLNLGKFVIPNPFGPLEEPRFTAYLMKNWFAGQTPAVNTPAYVRDNIHVSLLALAYRDFAEQVAAAAEPQASGPQRFNPSGYIETQGEFAQRFSIAMHDRLGLACKLDLHTQTEFPEPRERFNTDPVDSHALGWDESAAWDDVAAYYHDTLAG